MHVRFTVQQEEYIESLVKSGEYQNANEVVRDAIILYKGYRDKVIALRAEVKKGWDCQASQRKVSDIIAARTKVH